VRLTAGLGSFVTEILAAVYPYSSFGWAFSLNKSYANLRIEFSSVPRLESERKGVGGGGGGGVFGGGICLVL
jgi:hypothetical protein